MFDKEKDEFEAQGRASLLERFAKAMGSNANARTVYADPVERDGTTVIPVATVCYGLGAGSGTNKEHERGGGGGGGVYAAPVGYIQIRDGQTSFHPIVTNVTRIGVMVVGGTVGLLALAGIGRIVGKLKEAGKE